MLLEREAPLAALHRAREAAESGQGRLTVISGEAGIGKTALVSRFLRDVAGRCRVLSGACEPFFTPRPLGPLHELVRGLGTQRDELVRALEQGAHGADLFHAVLDAIRTHVRPTVIVLEDVHWADHATCDFIRFLARRVGKTTALLILTVRDDEIDAQHPLMVALGDVAAIDQTRLRLDPLSRHAVDELARRSGRDQPELHAITGGNPFFVTEVLRDDAGADAPTLREAVAARAARLSAGARSLLELVAISPERLELSLFSRKQRADITHLDECVTRGLLVLEDGRIGFRHELARIAIARTLTPARRVHLHRRILELLMAEPLDDGGLTRLAHHAVAALDVAAIIDYVPRAARAASERGAHREAGTLLVEVLPHVSAMPLVARAQFYEQRAHACWSSGQGEEAVAMSEAAYALWEEVGDPVAMGRNLVRRCDMERMIRNRPFEEIHALARAAIGLLVPSGNDDALALAYCGIAVPSSAAFQGADARVRERTLRLAERSTNADVQLEVLSTIVQAEYQTTGAPTLASTSRLMQAARRAHNDRAEMYAHLGMAWTSHRSRELDRLDAVVQQALDFAEDRQLERFVRTRLVERYRGEIAMARADWATATRVFDALGADPALHWWLRLCHLRVRSELARWRQGLAFDRRALDEALARADRLFATDLWEVHRAAVEISWMIGDEVQLHASAQQLRRIAAAWRHPWPIGEALLWSRLAAADESAYPLEAGEAAEPFHLAFSGQVAKGVEGLLARGCRFDAAILGLLGGDAEQAESVREMQRIGATEVARRARKWMRQRGASVVPVGPRRGTRANAAGLTARELQTLTYLAQGFSNSRIAQTLRRSPRTIEHHVAGVLQKLGARDRLEAVAIATRRGLVPLPSSPVLAEHR